MKTKPFITALLTVFFICSVSITACNSPDPDKGQNNNTGQQDNGEHNNADGHHDNGEGNDNSSHHNDGTPHKH